MFMNIHKFLFILPLLVSFILLYKYLASRVTIFKFKTIEEIQKNIDNKGFWKSIKLYITKIFDMIGKYTSPPKKSVIHKAYRKFLRFTKLNVESYFTMKFMTVIFVILLILMVRYTNISLYTQEIVSSYSYKLDAIYQQDDRLVDKEKALNDEVDFLYIVMDKINPHELSNEQMKEEILGEIKSIITASDRQLQLPSYTIANKVYYRLKDYYSVREPKYLLYFIILSLAFLSFDGVIFVYNVFAKADAKIELRFLKKLIILNGNFKDMNFTEILSLLIKKSKYYKDILLQIEVVNNKNTVENEQVYRDILSSVKDYDAKLFFEKLEQANNSNFNYAIKNIEEEELITQEERKIKVNQRVESIHAFGVVGAFIIIFLLINYLLIPWLQSQDISVYY